jgi:hypothetical protein
VAETRELVAHLDRLPSGVMHTSRHDQRVARVLVEQFVRLDVQRVGGNIPDRLIDADDLAAALFRRRRVRQPDQEDGVAVDRVHVDGAAEGDGQARLQVETVQRVDDADVVVVRQPRDTVWQREIDPAAGQLARIRNRESVAWERTALRIAQIEHREGAQQTAVFQDFDVQPASAVAGSHGENSSQKRDGLRYHARVTNPGAQTERRGGAGPVRGLLGGKAFPGTE